MTVEELKELIKQEVADGVAKAKPNTKGFDWNSWLTSAGRIVTPLLVALVGAGVLWLQSIGKDNQTKIEANHKATEEVATEVKATAKEVKRASGNPSVVIPSESK